MFFVLPIICTVATPSTQVSIDTYQKLLPSGSCNLLARYRKMVAPRPACSCNEAKSAAVLRMRGRGVCSLLALLLLQALLLGLSDAERGAAADLTSAWCKDTC